MKFSAICVACFMTGPAVALAGPEILPLDSPENAAIREISSSLLTVSARPLAKPEPSVAANQDQGAWGDLPQRVMSKVFALADPGKFSQMADPQPGTFRLASYETTSLNFPNQKMGADGAMTAAADIPEVRISPIERATLGRLVNRYASLDEGNGDEDLNRLFLVAEGKRESYSQRPQPVSIVDAAYEDPQQEQPAAAPGVVASDQASMAGGLTNEQMMTLIMAMANRPQVPASYLMPPVPYQPAPMQPVTMNQAPATLDGVPSLDYRGEDLPPTEAISAEGVPAGASPFSPEVLSGEMPQPVAYQAQSYGVPAHYPTQYQPAPYQPPAPAIVGDGSNLLLAGWKVGLTGSGGVGLYIEGDPSSIVEISEGMVVGILGSVSEISFQDGEIIASFTSGESVRGPARIVMSTSRGVGPSMNDEQDLNGQGSNEGTFSG